MKKMININVKKNNDNNIKSRRKRWHLYFALSAWNKYDSYIHLLYSYVVAEWRYRLRYMFPPGDEGEKFNKTIFLLNFLLLLYIRKLINRHYNQNFMIFKVEENIVWDLQLMLGKLDNTYDQVSYIGTKEKNLKNLNYLKLYENFLKLLHNNRVVQKENFCNNYFEEEIKCLKNTINFNWIDEQYNSSFFNAYFKCFYINKKVLEDSYKMKENTYIYGKCKPYFNFLKQIKYEKKEKYMPEKLFIEKYFNKTKNKIIDIKKNISEIELNIDDVNGFDSSFRDFFVKLFNYTNDIFINFFYYFPVLVSLFYLSFTVYKYFNLKKNSVEFIKKIIKRIKKKYA